MAKTCAICGKSLSFYNSRVFLSDGLICGKHWDEIGLYDSDLPRAKYMKVCDVKLIVDGQNESRSMQQQFKATKSIRNTEFDDDHKIFAIASYVGFKKEWNYFRYDQIKSFRLYEDGRNVTSANIGNAAIGGALFGSAGAVVGAMTNQRTESVCSSMYITIKLQNCYIPSVDITFVSSETERDSLRYSTSCAAAEATVKALDAAIAMVAPPKPERSIREQPTHNISAADEIRQYKQLLDDGIITEEEFQAKKKQLLDL